MAEPLPQLDYESPGSIHRQHSPRPAVMLCAPGAVSFALFFGNNILITNLPQPIVEVLGGLFWPLWFLAVATAIVSLCLYVRIPFKRLPGYVILNLFINISGLLFSVFAFAAMM